MKKPYLEREKLPNEPCIYSFFPFDLLDSDGSGVFKVGMSVKMDDRLRGYHTSLVKGYYIKCLLTKIPFPMKGKFSKSKNPGAFLRHIENEIFLDIERMGGEVIHIQNKKKKGGRTEWIFCKEDLISRAFETAQEKYNGKLESWKLQSTLKKNLKQLEKDSIFEGRIFFDD
jgi:hypothetical protein